MLAILQRIRSASVVADGEQFSQCGRGFLILLGVSAEDTEEDARLLAEKIAKLRVFQDEAGKMKGCLHIFVIILHLLSPMSVGESFVPICRYR